MKKYLPAVFFLLAAALPCFAQATASIPEIDRVRIAEAYRIGEKLQNKIWKNWDKAPFALLLITDESEFLIRHPKPSDEFRSIGYDQMLKSEVFVRPRKFQKSFLATFPAFSRTPMIVVGKAENTYVNTSTPWVFTVLHEHFHQLQMSQPTYFSDVDALNLSRGDTTGMWQINFPFAYSNKEAAAEFKQLSNLLLDAYHAANKSDRAKKLDLYLAKRRQFAQMLNADDYKYFSFQIWQEGIARYTQYQITRLAAKELKPSREFQALPDFIPFAKEADHLFSLTDNELRSINLTTSERVAFYPFGAFEGFLLDKINPRWQDKYFAEKFALEKFYNRKN